MVPRRRRRRQLGQSSLSAHPVRPRRGAGRNDLGCLAGNHGLEGRVRRERGAPAIEGYLIVTKDVIIEELHVGTKSVFAHADFTEVSRRTLRRVVMRIDF
jgi:hypothetical protein